MLNLCTYFDSRFLPRGLALLHSLKTHTSSFTLYVLALDDIAYNYLLELRDDQLHVLSLEEYSLHFDIHPEKYADKKQFYFSITPNICLYIFEKFREVEQLYYLDADLYFYQSADILVQEMGDASIAICSHHFHPIFKRISTHYGEYNVAINGFRKDAEGLKCLQQWKRDCEGWYPGMPGFPHTFFSDQIFLDSWPREYNSVKVITNQGIDVGPWNLNNISIKKRDGVYYANNQKLVVFHFSALHKLGGSKWKTNTSKFFVGIKGELLELYSNYISQIESYGLENKVVQKLTFRPSLPRLIIQNICKKLYNEIVEMPAITPVAKTTKG